MVTTRSVVAQMLTSDMGQKQTFRRFGMMSALPPTTDMAESRLDVRFVPGRGIKDAIQKKSRPEAAFKSGLPNMEFRWHPGQKSA